MERPRFLSKEDVRSMLIMGAVGALLMIQVQTDEGLIGFVDDVVDGVVEVVDGVANGFVTID